ncbi:response regulator [Cohnella luojiensis]|uniref:response regulator n=1 Tax=Cohnella luojiensis TaxID=652876 RepID=UPI001F10C3ED|nr:response regulator transcription factor [Cohnella luojiensis]
MESAIREGLSVMEVSAFRHSVNTGTSIRVGRSRNGVRNLIQTTEDMEIVGEASSGEEAVEKANTLSPDVILMDIRMSGMNGVEAVLISLRE